MFKMDKLYMILQQHIYILTTDIISDMGMYIDSSNKLRKEYYVMMKEPVGYNGSDLQHSWRETSWFITVTLAGGASLHC